MAFPGAGKTTLSRGIPHRPVCRSVPDLYPLVEPGLKSAAARPFLTTRPSADARIGVLRHSIEFLTRRPDESGSERVFANR